MRPLFLALVPAGVALGVLASQVQVDRLVIFCRPAGRRAWVRGLVLRSCSPGSSLGVPHRRTASAP